MAELKDFEQDWKINIKEKSATHKSGLTIAFDSMNEDGSMRLSYTGMMTWMKRAYSVTTDVQKIEEMRQDLSKQFVQIYQQKMCRTSQNIPTKQREF